MPSGKYYCDYCEKEYLHPNNNIPGFTNHTQPHARFANQQAQATSLNRDFLSGRSGTSWFDLPPSLKPPPEHGYPQLPSIDWG
ncbi:unnamed protein product [Arabis nemorensis]|uniref:Uncharacterized protein n=1 Tax=Arabis nemorensis TaxID=586526 RepID=A0A565CNM8_9BRAS|nr:unnamed protein product [Arabis nemorensis]